MNYQHKSKPHNKKVLLLSGALSLTVLGVIFSSCRSNNKSSLQNENQKTQESSRLLKEKCTSITNVPLTSDHWHTEYDGDGKVEFLKNPDRIFYRPKSAVKDSETHATLLLLKEPNQSKNFAISVEFKNLYPTRVKKPNNWEVFWLFFNYNHSKTPPKKPVKSLNSELDESELHLKETNYFIVKPNGLELGKAWGYLDQAYLWSAPQPRATYEETHRLTLAKVGQNLEIEIDNNKIGNALSSSDYSENIYDIPGQLGLYCEDAAVEIYSVQFCQLEDKK